MIKSSMKKTKFIWGIVAVSLMTSVITGCGRSKEPEVIQDFDKYISGIEELEVPEGTRIVALGEATHGNREFQQSKKEVFEVLAEKYDIRALIIEGDFGGCSLVNDYIQGGDGDSRELTKHLGYRLYRTDDMKSLIEWMHTHNMNVPEDQKVRLYGMDVQRSVDNIRVLKNFYNKVDIEKANEISSKLDELFGTEDDSYVKERVDEIIEYTSSLSADIDVNKDDYVAALGNDEVFRAGLAAQALNYYINLMEKENYSNKYRDGSMKALVDKVLEFEENEHKSELMMASHNGHMTKNQSSKFTFLGKDLYDELGDKYFAIGTDFYISDCNLPGKDGRITVEFCSDDPLAFNMKSTGMTKGLLEFSDVNEDSDLYNYISKKIPTGSIGEGYSIGMERIKKSHEVNFAPSDMYDAMILYYEVEPTNIWTD